MGLAGLVLKKSQKIQLVSVIEDVKLAAKRAGLEVIVDSSMYTSRGAGMYTTVNIANTFEDNEDAQQWLMYLYSDDVYCEEYPMIAKGEQLIRIITIENFRGCERMLLDFLYEYMNINPDDYFWDELDWHYTYEDIKTIKQKEYDPDWCYKKPKR